jgi:hypothetical protein
VEREAFGLKIRSGNGILGTEIDLSGIPAETALKLGLLMGEIVKREQIWRERCVAQDQLLICYRTGRDPSERLHAELERTRQALHALAADEGVADAPRMRPEDGSSESSRRSDAPD